jgi:cell wall-associated NlpC family hydrolase
MVSVVALASAIGITTAVISASPPASADQLSDARAEAAAITAKISDTEAQISTLTGRVEAAQYQVSQLDGQITASKAEMATDQAAVNKDQSQLRTQAISDYTNSGTSSQVTQMFSSSPNSAGIRSEYSSIASGNVSTTIDNLHTAQTKLAATQAALQGQQTQATATANTLQNSESQATALASQDKATLESVDTNIQNIVAAQQAAAAAAAKAAAAAAFNAQVAAAQRIQAAAAAQTVSRVGTSSATSASTGGASVGTVAVSAAVLPPVAAGASGAITAAESQIGVPYVWGGESPGSGFDCSGLVQWAWGRAGVGLPRTSGAQYAATTHISVADLQPGDLLFYGPGGSEHVAMYIGGGSMIEAPETGETVHITGVRTGDGFVGAGRVG